MKTADFKSKPPEQEDDATWRAAGKVCFEASYSPDDSIYDELIDHASTR